MTASPLRDRIASRTVKAGLSVAPPRLEQLERYYLLLARWNRTINLTALPLNGYPNATIDRLIVEPLLAVTYMGDSALNWFDFGSGGGSPAIPMKVMRPRSRLTMVESRERKSAFLREAVSDLDFSSASVVTKRIENLEGSDWRGSADLVTSRAVRFVPGIFTAAAVVLRPGGELLIFKGDIPLVFNDFSFEMVNEVQLVPLATRLSILRKIAERTC